MKGCLFCKIIDKEVPSDIIYEDQEVLAFKDIHPRAPLHFLILPKKHIISVNHLTREDFVALGNVFLCAKHIAKEKNLKGYKLIINVEKEGGQLIEHLHVHLLGGWKSPKERDVPETH